MKNPILIMTAYQTGLLLSEPDFDINQLTSHVNSFINDSNEVNSDNRLAMLIHESKSVDELGVFKNSLNEGITLPLTSNDELSLMLQQVGDISTENKNPHFTKKLQKDIIETENLDIDDLEKDINLYLLMDEVERGVIDSSDKQTDEYESFLINAQSDYAIAILTDNELRNKILESDFYDRPKILSSLVSMINENEQHKLLALIESKDISPIEHGCILESISDSNTKEKYEQGYREVIYSGLDDESPDDIADSNESLKQKGFKIK